MLGIVPSGRRREVDDGLPGELWIHLMKFTA